MKCYYEILGIPRDAEESEIKIAYRKLALKWHPDKNIENADFAKEQFQLVQQAYEVLSDRQERAWYDSHREQILRGADSTYTDNSLDVFPYFTTQCFSGYGDDERGFYTVYRKVFEKLAAEEMEHMESESDFEEIPSFGCSTSDYREVVAPFYAYWSHFSTRKSYVWLDLVNINDTVNRRHARIIEKENKKIRQKAKKERNEEIQNLVAFVRKRDKRVEAHAKVLEANKAERRKKQEELRKQKLLERQEELSRQNVEAEWAKFDNVKDQLKLIEKNLAETFGESVTDSDESAEDEELEDPDELFCAACNKIFKTKQARNNHDSSKKHRENLANLIRHFQQSEGLYQEMNGETAEEENGHLSQDEADVEHEKDVASETSKKKAKSKKVIRVEDHRIEDKSDVECKPLNLDDVLRSSKKQKKPKRKQPELDEFRELIENEKPPHLTVDSSDEDFSFSNKKNKKKNTKQKNKLNDVVEDVEVKPTANPTTAKKNKINKKDSCKTDVIDTTHCCAKCKSVFESKNKLFEHLKKTGHSIALPQKETKTKKNVK